MTAHIDYDSVLRHTDDEEEAKGVPIEDTLRCGLVVLLALTARAGGSVTITKEEWEAYSQSAVGFVAGDNGDGSVIVKLDVCDKHKHRMS